MGNHKRWIQPTPTPKAAPVQLDYDAEYVRQIMEHYHRVGSVPDMLPAEYKRYLLSVGLAELLPNCEKDYVVFSQAGGDLAKSMNQYYHRKGGRPRKSA